jgi:SHAQKYF class myb-like DNA-binding protein
MEGVYGSSGVAALSRDPKPRLRWTPDLHERFVDAVTKLGGPDSESPLSSLFISSFASLDQHRLLCICCSSTISICYALLLLSIVFVRIHAPLGTGHSWSATASQTIEPCASSVEPSQKSASVFKLAITGTETGSIYLFTWPEDCISKYKSHKLHS